MARIRTIKPEFWTDERLTECSLSARLLFIGMLNFSDDNGNQAHSAKRLKMQIFPADAIDVAPLLAELVVQGIVMEYSHGEEKYLHIKGFRKHQVINRPSSTTIPQPECAVQKHETHGVLIESSRTEGKGREGKGEETKALVASPAADPLPIAAPAKPDCPHQEIIALYHEVLPQCPQVRDWTAARQTQLRCRWNEDDRRQNLDYWRKFFAYVATCDFLVGKSSGEKPFFADLEWMTKSANFTKIREAKYENRGKA